MLVSKCAAKLLARVKKHVRTYTATIFIDSLTSLFLVVYLVYSGALGGRLSIIPPIFGGLP